MDTTPTPTLVPTPMPAPVMPAVPPVMPQPVQPKPKSARWLWLLLVPIVFAAAYTVYAQNVKLWPFGQMATSPSPTPTPSASVSATPNPSTSSGPSATDWTDFSSKYFTLSFKVPSGYSVEDSANIILIGKSPILHPEIGGDNAFFRLERYSVSTTKNSVLRSIQALQKDPQGIGRGTISSVEMGSVVVDGSSFTSYIVHYTQGGTEFGAIFDASHLTFTIAKGEDDISSIGYQILSTFKFTNASSTANWKTYTSNALNISFKYPADWVVTENNNYPGSAQGNDELRITKGSDVIYTSAKRDCLENATYCKAAGTWPSFSTISSNPDVKGIIDAIVATTTKFTK